MPNFFVHLNLEIWQMTLKNYRAPLLTYFNLCASFRSHWWIQWSKSGIFCPLWPWNLTDDLEQGKSEGFDSCDRPSNLAQIWVKIGNFLSRVTLKFDIWKTIGHLFHIALSFVHHFIAIGEFKLELQSGNAQFGLKSMFFCLVWPWNLTWPWKTIGHLFYAT